MVSSTTPSSVSDFGHLKSGLAVLVEEDESIRQTWQLFFSEKGLRLKTFESDEAFFAGFEPTLTPVEFFFDQDFGSERGVGLRLARIVRNWPNRTGTWLVTDYSPEDFSAEIEAKIIAGVFPKFPPPIFGQNYFETHILRRFSEQGHRSVMVDSIGKISSAFHGLLRLAKGRAEPIDGVFDEGDLK